MDTVFTDPAAGHYDEIARIGFLDMAGRIADPGGHKRSCAAVYERFAQIPVVEHYSAVHVGYTALVGAVAHTEMHAFEHASRVQQPGRQRFSSVSFPFSSADSPR